MSGLQEILLIIVIVLAIFFLPGIIRTRRRQNHAPRRRVIPPRAASGRLRLAILISLIWLALTAAYLKPWQSSWIPFVYIGGGPVALGWGLAWVVQGYKKRWR